MEALFTFPAEISYSFADAPEPTTDGSVIWWQFLFEYAQEWQTLIGALLALVAAYFTIRAMRSTTDKQLQAQKDEAKQQRERRLLACLAVMPADLSAIVQYAKDCAERSLTIRAAVAARAEDREQLECPLLPERVIANLQMLIEHLDEDNAKAVADILPCYQVQRARLTDLIDTYNRPIRNGTEYLLGEHNVEFTFEQTLELHLRATTAFDFARRKTDQIPVPPYTRETVANSLALLHLTDVLPRETIDLYHRFYSRADETQE